MKHKFFIKDDKAEIFHLKDFDNVTNFVNTLQDSTPMDSKYEVYNIATVSDKLINRRVYPDKHVLDTVLLNKWIKPFAKPLLTNHDIYSDALGRVRDNFYIKHSDLAVQGGICELPEEVIAKFKENDFLKDGTGSVVLKLDVPGHVLERMMSGQMLTTSQASSTDEVVCSICGQGYGDCDHIIGGVYEGKTAYLLTGELEPYENSVVNSPANDSSVILIFNCETKECFIYGTGENSFSMESMEPMDSQSVEEESLKIAKDSNLDILNKDKETLQDSVEGADMEKYKKQLKKFKDRAAFEFQKALNLSDEKLPDAMKVFDEISDEFSVELLSLVELIADSVKEINSNNEKLTNDNKTLQDKIVLLESAEPLKDSEEPEKVDDAEENTEANTEEPVVEPEQEVEAEAVIADVEEKPIVVEPVLEDNLNVEAEKIIADNVPDFLNVDEKVVEKDKPKIDNKRNYRHNVLNVSSNFGR